MKEQAPSIFFFKVDGKHLEPSEDKEQVYLCFIAFSQAIVYYVEDESVLTANYKTCDVDEFFHNKDWLIVGGPDREEDRVLVKIRAKSKVGFNYKG